MLTFAELGVMTDGPSVAAAQAVHTPASAAGPPLPE